LAQEARGPVTILIGWAPGGSTDVLGRLLAQRLSTDLGQSFVVENRPGASGIIASTAVARARPDGTMITLATNATYSMAPNLLPVPYDIATAFSPIGVVFVTPLLLVVSPRSSITSIAQLVERAKAAPGKMSYGSAGVGSSTHLACELLLGMAGIQVADVSYRGNAPAVQALLAGEVDFTLVDAPAVLSFVRSGDLRAIGVSTRQRVPLVPDVPSIAESGYPEYDCATEFALLAPAGTPAPTIARLHAAVAAALRSPDMQEKLAQQAALAQLGKPEDFAVTLAADSARWKKLVQERNIRVN
jgi:tripartite-type tricarboxylate transporter receptor subunit TctC